jgi:quercetin dioxygenase-like cupin family protein
MQRALLGRRQFLGGFCSTLSAGPVPSAFAAPGEDAGSAVLANNEPHHHVVLQNDLVRIFRVMIPPGASTLWHEHNFDFLVLAVNGTKVQVDVPVLPLPVPAVMVTKSLTYTDYAGKHFIHRITNVDAAVNHQLCLEIISWSPGGFEVADRSAAPTYKLEIENGRIRAWRVRLEPGEIARTITQKAPGVRFALSGDRIAETDSGGVVKETLVHPGDFAWLPAPNTRSIVNAGSSLLELIEIELR